MKKQYHSVVVISAALFFACLMLGCASLNNELWPTQMTWADFGFSSSDNKITVASSKINSNFVQSGSIILSRRLPKKQVQLAHLSENKVMAPLFGYLPPSKELLAPENKFLLELDSKSKTLTLFRGKKVVKTTTGEGEIELASGSYTLRRKQQNPLWFASDDYYINRKMNVPSKNNPARYLHGALGKHALYLSTGLSIHSSFAWDKDVGGLKVPVTELASIYDSMPIGAEIIVK